MLNPHRRPPPPSPRVDDGYLACYGIVVACVSLLLFTILAATVNIVKACALAGAVAVVFGAFGCVARWCADDGAAPALSTTVTPAARASATCGMVDAAINALPAFAYARPGTAGSEGGSSSKPSRHRLCAVCLEEIESGEMVRQLPACRHLFHVECIDMWLHSRSTCPLCRCDVSPQQDDVKPTAAAAPDATLPPV